MADASEWPGLNEQQDDYSLNNQRPVFNSLETAEDRDHNVSNHVDQDYHFPDQSVSFPNAPDPRVFPEYQPQLGNNSNNQAPPDSHAGTVMFQAGFVPWNNEFNTESNRSYVSEQDLTDICQELYPNPADSMMQTQIVNSIDLQMRLDNFIESHRQRFYNHYCSKELIDQVFFQMKNCLRNFSATAGESSGERQPIHPQELGQYDGTENLLIIAESSEPVAKLPRIKQPQNYQQAVAICSNIARAPAFRITLSNHEALRRLEWCYLPGPEIPQDFRKLTKKNIAAFKKSKNYLTTIQVIQEDPELKSFADFECEFMRFVAFWLRLGKVDMDAIYRKKKYGTKLQESSKRSPFTLTETEAINVWNSQASEITMARLAERTAQEEMDMVTDKDRSDLAAALHQPGAETWRTIMDRSTNNLQALNSRAKKQNVQEKGAQLQDLAHEQAKLKDAIRKQREESEELRRLDAERAMWEEQIRRQLEEERLAYEDAQQKRAQEDKMMRMGRRAESDESDQVSHITRWFDKLFGISS